MRSYALLHADHSAHGTLADLLAEKLGRFGEFVDEVLLHGVIDTLKLVGTLFLTYLLMEFIEHKASERVKGVMIKSGRVGPLVGGIFGAVPQCGFSAAAANLYTGRVITLGTLVAVFLSTSDEMLPILVAGNIKIGSILLILVYKCTVGIVMGFAIDASLKLMNVKREDINIDEICDNDDCHCERGIVLSALHHTLSVSLFVLAVTVIINALFFFFGDSLSGSLLSMPVVSHIICVLLGLVPNCASSVALSKLGIAGVISTGAMMSGLLAGAGVGLLVLFKMNKRVKENVLITVTLAAIGVIFGLLADLFGICIV